MHACFFRVFHVNASSLCAGALPWCTTRCMCVCVRGSSWPVHRGAMLAVVAAAVAMTAAQQWLWLCSG